MKFINLTPHNIIVLKRDKKIVFPPSSQVARVSYERGSSYLVSSEEGPITVTQLRKQESSSLPKPQPGVLYIVSRDVAQSNPDRSDLVVPDTERAVRDSQGQIVGVPGLISFSHSFHL